MIDSIKTLTLTEISLRSGIPKRTLYTMKREGRLPVKSIRGVTPLRYRETDVMAWIAGDTSE